MKKVLVTALLGAALVVPALAADVGVGVSVNIGEPGFFGQIDIGNMAPPPVVMPQPLIVAPVAVVAPPIYLRVPPEQIHDWRHYCYRYHACDRRVFFVQDSWYQNEYVPRYQHEHHPEMGREHHEHEEHGHDHDRRDDRGDYR